MAPVPFHPPGSSESRDSKAPKRSKKMKMEEPESTATPPSLSPLGPSSLTLASASASESQTSHPSEYSEIDSQMSQEASLPQADEALLLQHQVQGMSTHDLINNPCTLQAGLSVLKGHILQGTLKPLTQPQLSGDGVGVKEPLNSSDLSIPSAQAVKVKSKSRKRPVPSDEASPSGSGNVVKIHPPRSNTCEQVEDFQQSDIDPLGRCSSPCPSTSSLGSGFSTNSSTTSWSSCNTDTAGGEKGMAHFGELCRRFKLPEGSPSKLLDQFEPDKSSGVFLRSVFKDYDKKEKMYEKHAKKIEDLDVINTVEHFDRVKQCVLDIFEGRLQSPRMDMYVSDNNDDMTVLNRMCVSAPFLNPIFMHIANQITEFLFPKRKAKQKYLEVAQLVLIPETLIRIYASVNNIEYFHAEKEMRFGAQYDGPVPKKRKSSRLSNGSRRMRTRQTQQQHELKETKIEPESCTMEGKSTSSSAPGGSKNS